jgi:glycine betaine/proline transport system substrate-binding protein
MRIRLLALAAALSLVLAGCGTTSETAATPAPGITPKPCDTVTIAVNPWVGYAANVAVISYLAKHELGCKVVEKDLTEDDSWKGLASGTIDVILENWGHDDLKKQYIDDKKVAVELGITGNRGVIGWYVPPWLAKKYPDITDWQNLNKYATQFKTSESGSQGQLLDGDPSFVTNDEALVTNLKLNYKVVYAGSEAALIQSFKDAETNKKWVIGYFYSPQWFLSEVPLKKVALPPYKAGCDANAAKVACDYPEYKLNKILATKFANSGSPAVGLIKKFTWTNDDQNLVAKYITSDKMSPEDAAKKWVDANPDKVNAWLAG